MEHAELVVCGPVGSRSAATLAGELAVPLVSSVPASGRVLLVEDSGLAIRDLDRPELGTVRVDLASAFDCRPGTRDASRAQPLGRAVGSGVRTIVDATAGMGHDALLLALMGWDVVAIERSPVVGALLRDGLHRARHDADFAERVGSRLRLVIGEASRVLQHAEHTIDVVYLDPMYPPKRKTSALAKKSVRMLRQLVGDDDDADELFEIAAGVARCRVIVKRPRHAPPLVDHPTTSIAGKLARYDVYVRARHVHDRH